MSNWITIAKVTDIPIDQWKTITIDNTNIAVFNCDGEFYAVENICTHDYSPLVGEPIENCTIICPRHGARFCLKTGAVLEPPAYEDIKTFPVRIENGEVQVQVVE